MTTGPDNRRKVARIPIQLRIEYASMDALFAEYTKNLSRGGTFIRTPKPLAKGERFRFQIGIPGRANPFILTGEVAWTRRTPPEPGMGVRFVWENAQARATFEQTVERLMVELLGPEETARLLAAEDAG